MILFDTDSIMHHDYTVQPNMNGLYNSFHMIL